MNPGDSKTLRPKSAMAKVHCKFLISRWSDLKLVNSEVTAEICSLEEAGKSPITILESSQSCPVKKFTLRQLHEYWYPFSRCRYLSPACNHATKQWFLTFFHLMKTQRAEKTSVGPFFIWLIGSPTALLPECLFCGPPQWSVWISGGLRSLMWGAPSLQYTCNSEYYFNLIFSFLQRIVLTPKMPNLVKRLCHYRAFLS